MPDIYDAGSDAPEKLEEFYDHIAALPLSNPLFAWHRLNSDNVRIECIDEEVCIYKADDDDDLPSGYIVGKDGPDALTELIDQAMRNEN